MRFRSAIAGLFALVGAGASALAADCPGNPDALGTSRVITVDPAEHPRIGAMQYHETLPLQDKEVVLTFDDGPLPPYTNRVLETLAAECVKATFFMVGRQARAFPDMVRRVYNEGHTVASHSQNHPLIFTRLPMAGAEKEIEDGRASIGAALGDERALAPFFRFPGLGRSNAIEEYLAAQGIMTWSADFLADDWRRITAQQVLTRALTRLDQKGKGVLLLHDIQPRTALALPALLKALKARGYRIVQVVPAGPDRPKTVAPPEAWATRHAPLWPRVLEQDPAFAEGRPAVEMIDLAISVRSTPGQPEVVAVPLFYPTPGRSRLWPAIAIQFEPAEPAKLVPVAITGSVAAVALRDIGLAWSVEHVVWPPAARPAQIARHRAPIHFRRSAAAKPHRPRVEVPAPAGAKPRYASHILTLH
ncbi:MAG: polysaccharide deacetylase family protein [Hyphomicrobiales bacterium]|nr:polysaccharide deacetylase family protein [Hyphomicrobiales bacterium]MBV9429134.1 polysaccharide deacetylase family protein [Bradyrhizobiaceae bacterium]